MPLSDKYMDALKKFVVETAERKGVTKALRFVRIKQEYRYLVGQLGKDFVEKELWRVANAIKGGQEVDASDAERWARDRLKAFIGGRYSAVRASAMVSILRSYVDIERPDLLNLGSDVLWKLLAKAVDEVWRVK